MNNISPSFITQHIRDDKNIHMCINRIFVNAQKLYEWTMFMRVFWFTMIFYFFSANVCIFFCTQNSYVIIINCWCWLKFVRFIFFFFVYFLFLSVSFCLFLIRSLYISFFHSFMLFFFHSLTHSVLFAYTNSCVSFVLISSFPLLRSFIPILTMTGIHFICKCFQQAWNYSWTQQITILCIFFAFSSLIFYQTEFILFDP